MSDDNIENSINEIFEKALNGEINNKDKDSIRLEDNDQAFNNLVNLQLLIQKQSGLKELCK